MIETSTKILQSILYNTFDENTFPILVNRNNAVLSSNGREYVVDFEGSTSVSLQYEGKEIGFFQENIEVLINTIEHMIENKIHISSENVKYIATSFHENAVVYHFKKSIENGINIEFLNLMDYIDYSNIITRYLALRTIQEPFMVNRQIDKERMSFIQKHIVVLNSAILPNRHFSNEEYIFFKDFMNQPIVIEQENEDVKASLNMLFNAVFSIVDKKISSIFNKKYAMGLKIYEYEEFEKYFKREVNIDTLGFQTSKDTFLLFSNSIDELKSIIELTNKQIVSVWNITDTSIINKDYTLYYEKIKDIVSYLETQTNLNLTGSFSTKLEKFFAELEFKLIPEIRNNKLIGLKLFSLNKDTLKKVQGILNTFSTYDEIRVNPKTSNTPVENLYDDTLKTIEKLKFPIISNEYLIESIDKLNAKTIFGLDEKFKKDFEAFTIIKEVMYGAYNYNLNKRFIPVGLITILRSNNLDFLSNVATQCIALKKNSLKLLNEN